MRRKYQGSESRPHAFDAIEKWIGAVDIETEKAVLCGMMTSPARLPTILAQVTDSEFTIPGHVAILQAIQGLYLQSKPVNMVTVSAATKGVNVPDVFAGQTSYIDTHLKDLLALSARRRAIKACMDGLVKLREQTDLDETASTIINNLSEISNDTHNDQPTTKPINEVVDEAVDHVRTMYKRRQVERDALSGIPTGFRSFDMQSSGLHPGELVIVAARPGVGKTAMLAQICENAAIAGFHAMFCSAEMPPYQIGMRLLASGAVIPNWKLRRGDVDAEQIERLFNAQGRLGKLPVVFCDSDQWEIIKVKIMALHKADNKQLKLIIVDYLQLLRARGTEGELRYQMLGRITREAKKLALQLQVVVILACQISRGVDKEGERRPRLSDLRESGDIEQNADVVTFLWHSDSKNRASVEWFLAKNRSGPVAATTLNYDGDLTRFYESE